MNALSAVGVGKLATSFLIGSIYRKAFNVSTSAVATVHSPKCWQHA